MFILVGRTGFEPVTPSASRRCSPPELTTLLIMVPETGIEPVRDIIPRDFKSLASAYSATPAHILEAAPGFEPGIKDLQSSALPLGYAAI